jgi:hypothetical protein
MRFLVLMCVGLCISVAAWADTYVVRPDETGDFPTIQAAVDAAVDGDIIELVDGTFSGEGNCDIEYLGKAITIRSQSGDPETCVIDCGGTETEPHRGFCFCNGEGLDSVLEGVTITNGYAPLYPFGSSRTAGAIHFNGCSGTVENCVFSDNLAPDSGGAVMIWNGAAPVFTDCLFIRNEVQGFASGAVGGGFSINPTFERCTFIDNSSTGGSGAIGVGFGSGDPTVITMEECHFEGNQASGPWGALGVGYGATGYAFRCTFVNNHAGNTGGAAGCPEYGHLELIACTFAGNSSDFGGGAVGFYLGSTGVLRGCTLYGNSAPVGAGVLVETASDAATLENTIVSFSTMGEAVGGPGAATLTCCDVFGNAGGDYVGPIAGQLGVDGNISGDPVFCDAESGDFTLNSPSSPCLGSNSGCGLIGSHAVGCGPGGIGDAAALGVGLYLGPSIPNPFGTSSGITYVIPESAGNQRARLSVYDAAGRLVRVLIDSPQPTGVHHLSWDGTNHKGARVPNGVYFYELVWNGKSSSRRMIVLR